MGDNREFEHNESFAAIFTQATQALVCVYDRDTRILLFNDACQRAPTTAARSDDGKRIDDRHGPAGSAPAPVHPDRRR